MTQGISKLQDVFYPRLHEEWLRDCCQLPTKKQTALYYPEPQKRIHLFGDCTGQKAGLIKSIYSEFGVLVTFNQESGQNDA